MPRPKKIVQESVVEETTSISSYVEPESIIEAKMQVIENFTDNSLIEEPIIEFPKQTFKIYHMGNFVADAQEDSDMLNEILEKNRVQLYENIDKLKQPTSNQEDLALFNIPQCDNRVYNSLAQYYQQNGFAPMPPKIIDWMTYYKIKYPSASEEEIAISVFGPLDYSFEII